MSRFIDRRLNGKNKSAVNRQRFIKRYKTQIKQAIADSIHNRSVSDTMHGEKVSIPVRDTQEPVFQHGEGGYRETVYPGNKEFITGEKIPRPRQGAGRNGSQASNTGEGEDNFSFELSREEFYDLFFDDLELPNLVKTQLLKEPQFKRVRAGYTRQGVPARLNVVRSLKQALGRRISLANPYKNQLHMLQEELATLNQHDRLNNQAKLKKLEDEIKALERKIKAVPYLDDIDLRYNLYNNQPEPSTQAVMICVMDVSGSMDETKKDLAKRFFMLLYLFLTHHYEKIELVFIRHHTAAAEVSEEDFFYSRETGGTVVSSALNLMHKVIQARYPTTDWNIYVAQASDGDNWNADSPICRDLLINSIMPYVQYYAYVEILAREPQSLWQTYLTVKEHYPNFAMQEIYSASDIYPVLHKLFSKAKSHESG